MQGSSKNIYIYVIINFCHINRSSTSNNLQQEIVSTLKVTAKRVIEQSTMQNKKQETSFKREEANKSLLSHFKTPSMSKELKKGINYGYFISRIYLLPVMPKYLGGHLWLLIEMITAASLLILSLINMKFTANDRFINVGVPVLTVFFLLALIDGCFFWCGMCIQQSSTDGSCNRPCSVVPKCYTAFSCWYEIIRTIASEILLYPLIVLCLFELLDDSTFDLTSTEHKLVFSIFIISSTYIILSVYVVRPLMILITISRLQSVSSAESGYIKFFVRFFVFILTQSIAQILCFASSGMKIHRSATGNVSPFLWVTMIGGWMVPFMGIVSFLLANYYWLQRFFLEIFIDVISCLEQQAFSEAVFEGQDAINESENVFQITCYYNVQQETKASRDELNLMAKLLYPLKTPLFLLYAIIYNITVGGFIACLVLDYDSNGTIAFDENFVAIVAIFFLLMSNFQTLFSINIWLVIAMTTGVPLLIIMPISVAVKHIKNQKNQEYTMIV